MTRNLSKCAVLLSTCAFTFLPTSAFSQDLNCDVDSTAAGCESTQDNDNTDDGFLGTLTILGNRAPVDVLKYPGSVSVVDVSEKTQATTAIEALKSVPGFGSGGDSGREAGQQFSVRGFGYQSEQRVIVKVDGVKRSPGLFSNHVSSFRTDPTIIKRAEVAKGGASMLHGSGAIGGVVAMETKDAYDFLDGESNFGVTASARYDSNNKRSATLTFAGASEKLPIDFVLHGRFVKAGDITLADGGIEGIEKKENDSKTYNAFGKLGIDISDDQRLEFSLQHYQQDLTTVWQTLYFSKISETSPVEGSLVQKDAVAKYTWNPADNDLIDFSARLYRSNEYYDRSSNSTTDPADTLQYKNENQRWGAAVKNIAKFDTGGWSHRLTVGLDYDKVEEDSSYVRRGVKSPFALHPAKGSDLGVYFQNEVTTPNDRLTLSFGGRYDRYERQIGQGKTYSGDNFAPRVGASFDVTPGFTLLANYSETFRAPTTSEYASEGSLNPHYWYVPNPDLSPETAKEYELGFSVEKSAWLHSSDELRVKAMFFSGEIEDMINLEALGRDPIPGYGPLSPDYNNYQQFAQYQNVSNAQRRGLEVTADYWVKDWHMELSFEHLDIYNKDTKKKVPQGFADKLRLAAAYTHQPWDLTLGAEVNHWFAPEQNPKSFVSRGTTYWRARDSYTQANVKGTWTPSKGTMEGFEVVAGVNNLFDKQYINARDTETTSRVGTGRNYFIQLKKSF